MGVPTSPPPDGKPYRIRGLKRGDKDAVFRLLAEEGWTVPAGDQELTISWIVQHPETETLVAHDPAAYSRLFGLISMSHRPQIRLGGRVASIDLFLVSHDQRGHGIGLDLLAHSTRRAEALGCKRLELSLTSGNDFGREFFLQQGFAATDNSVYVKPLKPITGRAG